MSRKAPTGFRGDFNEHIYPYVIGPVREGPDCLQQRALHRDCYGDLFDLPHTTSAGEAEQRPILAFIGDRGLGALSFEPADVLGLPTKDATLLTLATDVLAVVSRPQASASPTLKPVMPRVPGR
jgi:hypothetical protein